jgi:predicted PolB exonuclease-like 3'-5' exonuclease
MNIYFDIETIPCQSAGVRDDFLASVRPPAVYKKPESIAAWLAENREAEGEQAWLQTSFDGGLGQVVAIAWAVDEADPHCLHVEDLTLKGESDLLACWFREMGRMHSTSGTRPVLVGHNIVGFDLPFLWKRAMIHRVRPPAWFPRHPKPWAESIEDTMYLWDSEQRKGAGLDRICKLMGLAGKDGISGADVWPMVRAGRIKDVAKYCLGDVRAVRSIHHRMHFIAEPDEMADVPDEFQGQDSFELEREAA